MRVFNNSKAVLGNKCNLLIENKHKQGKISNINIQERRNEDVLDRTSLDKINNAHLLTFKSKKIQTVEPMNFKTNGIFLMLKECFELKSKILNEDLVKFREALIIKYPKYEINLPVPILAIDSEAYGCEFLLLRKPVENNAEYSMIIKSGENLEKVEFKERNLVANFSPKDKGLTLNEYVLIGLESQMANIKTQEKLDMLEMDYQLRDSKVTEYVDNGLSNIQKQINQLKEQVEDNTTDINKLKQDIKYIDEKIKDLRKELKLTANNLYNNIKALDFKNEENYANIEKRIKKLESTSGGGAVVMIPPSKDLFNFLVVGESVKYVN